MAKIKTTEVKTEKKKADFMEVLTGIWMVAMLAVFPLFFRRAYEDILPMKYGFMLVAGGILLAGFIIWALIAKRPKQYIAHMKSYADPSTGKWFSSWFKGTFNTLDIFMLAFLIIVIISTLCSSPYMYQAIFGNEGRWVGTITLVMICLTFFVASRYFVYKRWYIDVFLIASLIAALWCISDYFEMDIMKFKYKMDIAYRAIFVSTIGNIDTYAGYAAIPMAFSGAMYVVSKEGFWRKLLCWICFAAVTVSLVTCGADNAYLAIGVLLAFIPLAATKTKAGIRRCIIVYATVFSAIALIGYLNVRCIGIVLQPSGALVQHIGTTGAVKWAAIIFWLIALALFIYEVLVKKYPEDTPAPKIIHTIWIVLLILGAVGAIVLIGIANTNPTVIPSSMESLKSYLILSDEWGTWRMYVWKKLLGIYATLPFINKLFGTGPETASIYLYNKYYFDIADTTGFLFDSMHNEWLQVFFTMGPLGLIAYLGVYISPVVMAFKRNLKKYYPIVLGVGFVGICHLGESFVNLMTPMDIPIIFALLALAQSLFRSKE